MWSTKGLYNSSQFWGNFFLPLFEMKLTLQKMRAIAVFFLAAFTKNATRGGETRLKPQAIATFSKNTAITNL